MSNIYLAGPISGLSYEEASQGWRRRFAELIPSDYDIACYSPMRAKEFLSELGHLGLFGEYPDHPLSTESGIVTRDHNDVKTCDLMVACFLESQGRPSLGTAIEFGWAHAYQKPIILVAAEGDPHREHPMLHRMAGYVVDDLETAAAVACHVLLPGI